MAGQPAAAADHRGGTGAPRGSARRTSSFDVAWRWREDLDEMLQNPGVDLSYEDESYGSLSTTSLSVSPFNAPLRCAEPGETVTFLLVGEARLEVGAAGVEGGGKALVGGPFEVWSLQGPVFNFTVNRDTGPTQPAAVPVPAAAWLLVTALLPIFALRRPRRTGTGPSVTRNGDRCPIVAKGREFAFREVRNLVDLRLRHRSRLRAGPG